MNFFDGLYDNTLVGTEDTAQLETDLSELVILLLSITA
jgi:hypothetical protein